MMQKQSIDQRGELIINQVQVFNFEGKNIRTIIIDNQPWFVGKDICDVLSIKNITQAMNRLDEDERSMFNIGRQGEVNIVNESGLYSLILRSDKVEAKLFRKWVTSEILPSIRRHGAYITEDVMAKTLNDPDYIIGLIKAMSEAKQELNIKNQIIGELRPKADYMDRILKSKSLVTITQIAKDYGMSGKELNRMLHEYKIQYKQSEQWFLYEKYQNKGYTHSETIVIEDVPGLDKVVMNTKWTQKGRVFLYGVLKHYGIVPMIERS